MSFFDLISSRHSVRAFLDKKLPDGIIQQIASAATKAASAGNLQSYQIFIITKKEDKHKLAEAAHGQDNHTAFTNYADPTVHRSFQEEQHCQNPLVLSNKAAQRIFKHYLTAFLKTYVDDSAEAKPFLEKADRDRVVEEFQVK